MEFTFEDLNVSIDGLYCGCFVGDAEIDDEGSVIAITLHGWNGFERDAKAATKRFEVPPRVRGSWPLCFAEKLICALASEIEAQCDAIIADCISDDGEARRIREYEPDEVA